jgi:hypothetical protein
MADNIQEKLAGFSKKIDNNEVAPTSTASVVSEGKVIESEVSTEEEDIFDGAVIAGLSDDSNHSDEELNVAERWRRTLREKMADMASKDPDQFQTESDKMVNELFQYRKDMMIKGGMTMEEADMAAENRLKNKATAANSEYLKENPNLAIIKIDKSQADSLDETLNFTEEEKQRIVKSKAIRIIEVEDKRLSTIKIKSAPSDANAMYHAIHRVSCNVSKYEMPVINTFDICEFSGATTAQLAQAVYDEQNNLYRKYQDQLELVYAKFNGSSTIDKYDANGEIIFTKEDFAKWFKFHDLAVAMYSIYVASSTEEITSRFDCPEEDGGCGVPFEQTYNTKQLIKYKDIPDNFKQDMNDILETGNDRDKMKALRDERRKAKRFESKYTNNIYDLSAPSVARALGILRYVRPSDQYSNYLALYAMMIENIFVYDPEDGEYYQISYDRPDDIMRFMYDITDMEIKLLTKVIGDIYYVPSFEITTVCKNKNCGMKRTREFSVDELVFLKAQNIGEEID